MSIGELIEEINKKGPEAIAERIYDLQQALMTQNWVEWTIYWMERGYRHAGDLALNLIASC